MAIDIKCIPAVDILLAGDCLEFLASSRRGQDISLPSAFRKVAERGDSRLHDIIIKCLLRHKFLLPRLLPYHDLARGRSTDMTKFAKSLFIAGFRDMEAYDSSGYTPLMISCINKNIRMASFLMQHGADPHKCHEHGDFKAGHFLCYDSKASTVPDSLFDFTRHYGFRAKSDEKQLLEAAFDTTVYIGSYCRCSPDGFSPITTIFRDMRVDSTYFRKQSFQELIGTIDSPTDRKKYWRAFVIGEVFDRLEMTHTCPTVYPKLEFFPDNRRIEIEDEEEELFFELEEIVARFDMFSENFGDDLSRCVNEFFDDLDYDLPMRYPKELLRLPWHLTFDLDCLGSGQSFDGSYLSCRGQVIKYGHKEIVEEESMLRLLFS